MNIVQFQSLLERNQIDNSCEQEYQRLFHSNPLQVIHFLVQIIDTSPNTNLSNYSIVLLSRNISILSKQFLSIGNVEFHNSFLQSIFQFISNPSFSFYSLSLLSDLISRISLTYSYESQEDTVFSSLLNAIQSPNIANSAAGIESLVLCIYNESISNKKYAQPISQVIQTVFSINPINIDLLLPTLRLLYLTFDAFDFFPQNTMIFDQIADSPEIVYRFVHDIATYLPREKFSFFKNTASWFISYLSSLMNIRNVQIQLKYCALEILSDFSEVYYDEFLMKINEFFKGVYCLLYDEENDNATTKATISKISKMHGGVVEFSITGYEIFINNVSNVDPKCQIAAMRLFAYFYSGIFTHISIQMPFEYIGVIISSNVLDSANTEVRKTAFDLMSQIFKKFSQNYTDFDKRSLYQTMISHLSDPCHDVQVAKYRAFSNYLKSLNEDFICGQCLQLQKCLIQLAQISSSDEEQLCYILECFQSIIMKCPEENLDYIKNYLMMILQNPIVSSYRIYFLAFESISFIPNLPMEVFYMAFSLVFQMDLYMLTNKELRSIECVVYTLWAHYPNYLRDAYQQFLEFALNGVTKDIRVETKQILEISYELNKSIDSTIDRQDNVIRCYDSSQIQLTVLYLKVLRYVLNCLSPDLISPSISEQIMNVLLNWSDVDFSDRLLYNALKTAKSFINIAFLNVPNFLPFLERTVNFATVTIETDRLATLYSIIKFYFSKLASIGQLNEDLYKRTFYFFMNENAKANNRRNEMAKQVELGDCYVNPNHLTNFDRLLSQIWLPYFSTEINFPYTELMLSLLSSQATSVSIYTVGYYFMMKERSLPILNFLLNTFFEVFDEYDKSDIIKQHFGVDDAKAAGIMLFNIVHEKMLIPEQVQQFIEMLRQKDRFEVSKSEFLSIFLAILYNYKDHIDNNAVFSLIEKTEPVIYIEKIIQEKVIAIWNNIFQYLSQQCFGEKTLTVLLSLVFSFSHKLDADYIRFQCQSLLINFQGDRNLLLRLTPEQHRECCLNFLGISPNI